MKTLYRLLIASMMLCAPLARAQRHEYSPPLRAEQLMGSKVEDTDGRKIGTVRNLILDTRSGQLKYAVIGSGGFFGMRSTLRLAPSAILSAATIKRNTLAIDATMDEWVGAPVFKASRLASLSEPGRAREIAAYFEHAGAGGRGGGLAATGSGAAGRSNAQPESLRFASDLTGLRVVNSKQQGIGEVMDLLVSFGPPHPAYAILSTGGFFRRGHEYALPLSELKPEGSKLLANLGGGDLEKAPPFTQQVWDGTNAGGQPAVYRYSKPAE